MDIKNQIEFYDAYWSGRKVLNNLKLRRAVKILDYFVTVKREIKEPRIIELGSGDGRFTAFIGEFGNADAIELSKEAVVNANKLYPHVNYIHGNALEYPLEHAIYDVVISQEVIEHIEEQDKYFDVCFNILKPGGYLILTTPNKKVFDHMEGGNWSRQPIEKVLTPKELNALVKKKFKIIDYDSIILNFGRLGHFKIINSSYITGFFNKIGLKKTRERTLGKLGYGLHQCVFAKK
ncbi:class I SAM-dependent methyltransferase [Winogradskyella schleiferi]|uniref:class I SAM-dependent methyltransferase n=1 Tax=Winogradskyella schleiferi TaxID=2686078 RepID=UPI0015C09265|nr:class I SAM-dependent methyltransferase [Winogradskyella schleiferi]